MKTDTAINYPHAPETAEHWILTIPVISTGHLPQDELNALLDSPCCVSKIPEGGTFRLNDSDMEDWPDEEYPAFLNVMMEFLKLDYEYLRFDADGDVVPGLEVFDW